MSAIDIASNSAAGNMDTIIFYSMSIPRTFHIPSAVYISRNGTAGHINGSSNISIIIYRIAVIPIYMFR